MNNGNCSINHCKGNNCALYIFGFSTWSKNTVHVVFQLYIFFPLLFHPSDSIPFFTSVEVSSLMLLLSCSWELHFPYCHLSSSLSPEVSVSIVAQTSFLSVAAQSYTQFPNGMWCSVSCAFVINFLVTALIELSKRSRVRWKTLWWRNDVDLVPLLHN